jgi:glycerol-3-phosphate dehydrogenase subunit B
LAAELRKLIQPGERIGLPAILGLDAHAQVMDNLQTQTGAGVFEISTLPPSVPGLRLTAALRQKVESLGARIEINMPVKSFSAQGGRIAWIETDASARPLKHHADKFLLATGGILGGGINSDHTGRVWETCFNLPLTAPQTRGEWLNSRFLDPAGHPIFTSGVPVNRQFQPIDAQGAPVYSNLWAAGGTLAHADPIRECSLEGIAIATGIAAIRCVMSQT